MASSPKSLRELERYMEAISWSNAPLYILFFFKYKVDNFEKALLPDGVSSKLVASSPTKLSLY